MFKAIYILSGEGIGCFRLYVLKQIKQSKDSVELVIPSI